MFVPYNPRMLRLGLFICSVACVVLAAWALADARDTGALSAWARLGFAAGLLAAFAYVSFRIRPREGWGVRVEPLTLTISRPLSSEPVEIPWSRIAEVRRDGKRREKLLIRIKPEGRILLWRRLFVNNAQFEELAQALESRAPAVMHDA